MLFIGVSFVAMNFLALGGVDPFCSALHCCVGNPQNLVESHPPWLESAPPFVRFYQNKVSRLETMAISNSWLQQCFLYLQIKTLRAFVREMQNANMVSYNWWISISF